MSKEIKHIVVVGGGTAGWLSAGIIAAHYNTNGENAISVTLIESPDVPTIGVGEGTWPSMRGTLKKLGISEAEFITQCDASFKQASKFYGWTEGGNDAYYHPFTMPTGYFDANLAEHWLSHQGSVPFADAISSQSVLCAQGLAPKQISTPEYAFIQNYGYHLDAGKFAALLTNHCKEKLGVKHILDNVVQVQVDEHNDITSLATEKSGNIEGDLFIDCSGFHALLIDKHYQVAFESQKHVLFNDSALAAHVPYETNSAPIASHTVSTAQTSGWIWDIGLQSRRGVGHVYASNFISDDQAEQQLRQYIADTSKIDSDISIRKLTINPGYRQKFWQNNCVAIGLSAGFIEPLEASAIALIELSATFVAEQLPANRQIMDVTAKRFNQKFTHRWQRIIEFLKLHYVLSKRNDSDYWIANRQPETIPEHLKELLDVWQFQTPYQFDTHQTDELFPAASFQYVLYGMGYPTKLPNREKRTSSRQFAQQLFNENIQRTKQMMQVLPTNRELINKIKQYGLSKV
ncbi:tryptophan halogenase family protein [Thalassotalea euphylliae]|uniref:tryptophan halogenase family protein n=1 Tax=Thalassotalea euphylliae TaxID=1655234 RepID=UPI0036393EE9